MEGIHYLANYTIEQEIGHGSFATVYLGREQVKEVKFCFSIAQYTQKSNAKVAIKVVSLAKLNKKLAENLVSEISILKNIEHPNIVKLYEIQVIFISIRFVYS